MAFLIDRLRSGLRPTRISVLAAVAVFAATASGGSMAVRVARITLDPQEGAAVKVSSEDLDAAIKAVNELRAKADSAMMGVQTLGRTANDIASALNDAQLGESDGAGIVTLEALVGKLQAGIPATEDKLTSAFASMEVLLKPGTDGGTTGTSLAVAFNALDNLKAKIPPGREADWEGAKAAGASTLQSLTAAKVAAGNAKTELLKAFPQGTVKLKGFVDRVAAKAGSLEGIDAETDESVFLKRLIEPLSSLGEVRSTAFAAETDVKRATILLRSIYPTTTAVEANSATLAALDTSVVESAAKVKANLNRLKPWGERLVRYAKVLKSEVDGTAKIQEAWSPTQIEGAKKLAEKAEDESARIGSSMALFPALDYEATKGVASELVEARSSLAASVAGLRDRLAGDVNSFVTGQVSLYYNTDVRRLILMLNPAAKSDVGLNGLQQQATAARAKLAAVDADILLARGTVNARKKRVEELREEFRMASQSLGQAEASFHAASLALSRANRARDAAVSAEQKARTANTALPNATNAELLKKAEEVTATATEQASSAQDRKTLSEGDRDTAKARVQGAAEEQAALPTQIRSAVDALENAQATRNQLDREARSAAQALSDAFALTRDNASIMVGQANVESPDPAKRVFLYAFDDRKTIFIRGLPDDIDRVKEIIADFDRPAPQARITLWSIELDSIARPDQPGKLHDALMSVEHDLNACRAQTAAAISILRDCVNWQVAECQRANISAYENAALKTGSRSSYPELYARYHFYTPEVSRKLGFDQQTAKDNIRGAYFSRYVLPDPASTTTLGETLMVLCLADRNTQDKVLNMFATKLSEELGRGKPIDPLHPYDPQKLCHRLQRCLGQGFYDGKGADGALSPQQREIVFALQRLAFSRVMSNIDSLGEELHLISSAKVYFQSVVDWTYDDDKALAVAQSIKSQTFDSEALKTLDISNDEARIYALQTLYSSRYLGPFTDWLTAEFALSRSSVESLAMGTVADRATAKKKLLKLSAQSFSNARIAAADQMLKEMIIAVEDDFDEHFVHPTIVKLRQDLLAKHVNVGIVNRTSVLSTNRLVARVDPLASAELDLGEEISLLDSAKQLAQLTLAAQTGGLLGAVGLADTFSQKPTQELYGLNTGSVFQVTPIFDPSGQALRFKFDYVSANPVREPNGTTNRALPRIERHAVNTEVQLSNLELREISRFESNSKLGVPRTRTGGIPILKDIPGVREIPLIGWFTQRGGRDAVSQHNLILGQTTMYPTIGDIGTLLASGFSLPSTGDGEIKRKIEQVEAKAHSSVKPEVVPEKGFIEGTSRTDNSGPSLGKSADAITAKKANQPSAPKVKGSLKTSVKPRTKKPKP